MVTYFEVYKVTYFEVYKVKAMNTTTLFTKLFKAYNILATLLQSKLIQLFFLKDNFM